MAVYSNEHHHFELEKSLHSKMNKLYVFQAILTFVKSSLGIFVPVYLYKIGYSIADVLFYVIGISLVYLILIPISVKIINKIGFKYTILLSIPIYFLHILSLNYVIDSIFYFTIAWFSFGVYMAIFWPAMHSEIALNGSAKHRGSQIGTLQIISTLFATMSPLIGGYILQVYGYSYLMFFTTFFLIIGILPLIFSQDIKLRNYDFNYEDYFKLLKKKNLTTTKEAFSAEGIQALLNLNLWPIILFILLSSSFLNLGILFTVTSLISILFVLYLKSYIDKKDKHKTLKIISKFISLSWYLRAMVFLFGSFFLYFIEMFFRLINATFNLTFYSIFYNNASKKNYMDYIILRELYLHLTKILFGIIFIIVLGVLGENMLSLLTLVLLGIIMPIWLSYFKEE